MPEIKFKVLILIAMGLIKIIQNAPVFSFIYRNVKSETMNTEQVLKNLIEKNPTEFEYHQAVREVLESIEEVYNRNPRYEAANIIERITEPDRVLMFRVP